MKVKKTKQVPKDIPQKLLWPLFVAGNQRIIKALWELTHEK